MPYTDRRLLGWGGIVGGCCFLVGWVATSMLASPGDHRTILRRGTRHGVEYGELKFDGGEPSVWEVGGWIFLEANGGSIDATIDGASASIAAGPSPLEQLLALGLLLAGGFLLASGPAAARPATAAIRGAHIAVGYAIMAGCAALLLSWEGSVGDTPMQVDPDPVTIVLTGGLLIPALIGALGGFGNHLLGRR